MQQQPEEGLRKRKANGDAKDTNQRPLKRVKLEKPELTVDETHINGNGININHDLREYDENLHEDEDVGAESSEESEDDAGVIEPAITMPHSTDSGFYLSIYILIAFINANILAFSCVGNDGSADSLNSLLQLKCIFTRQLPNMPKPYTTRLVFDRQHRSLIGSKAGIPFGGITFRPFFPQGFIEIVFCAVTGDEQVRGYGTMLMNHLKKYCQENLRIFKFLTCADNGAVGYFKKQGFSEEIKDEARRFYQPYIKDYNETTLMECVIRPSINYLDVRGMLKRQRAAVLEKLRQVEREKIVHPGLEVFREGGHLQSVSEIPGLLEAGYRPEDPPHIKRAQLREHLSIVHHNLVAFHHSWPFREPVNRQQVHDYYDVIKEPMDLKTIGEQLQAGKYDIKESFLHDVMLVIDNCRTYNNEDTVYYECATKLERYLDAQMRKLRRVL
jgi:histone acetyltransferase